MPTTEVVVSFGASVLALLGGGGVVLVAICGLRISIRPPQTAGTGSMRPTKLAAKGRCGPGDGDSASPRKMVDVLDARQFHLRPRRRHPPR